MLLPGSGQWYAGRSRKASWMLAIAALIVAVWVWLWSRGEVFLLKLSVQPRWILALLAAAVAVGIFRIVVVVDAFRSVDAYRPRSRWATLGAVAGLGVLLVATLLPHVVVARYAVLQHDLITSVFAPNPPAAAPPLASTTTSTTTPVTAGDRTSTTLAPPAPTTTTTAPPATASPLWEEGERLNVLFMGGDAGPGRRGIRTDTMIVVSIDPDSGAAAMFGIPRNFTNMPLAAGPAVQQFPNGFTDIANAIYQYGLNNPDLFPGETSSGATAIKGSIGELLGIDIHFYALVELQGFVDLIDAVGGVTVYVPERVYDAAYPHEDGGTEVIDILPGTYDMDGHMALAYARSRRSSDDYNRMGRQRCVLEALVEQADAVALLRAFPDLVPVIKDTLTTDIPVAGLPDLIDVLAAVDTARVVSVRFIPPRFITGRNADRYPIPDVAGIRSAVATILELPPEEAVAALNLESLDRACPEGPVVDDTPGTTEGD